MTFPAKVNIAFLQTYGMQSLTPACSIYSTSICVVVTLNMRSVLYFYHTMVLPLHSKRDIVKCVCVCVYL